jgi:uncharacterized protein RhaS with RHS repeats
VVGWGYDLVGNLTSDGASTYTYDALNRLKTVAVAAQTRSYSYNGDGALVLQIAGTTRISLTQDLAAPLSQVVQARAGAGAVVNYLFGRERLVLESGARSIPRRYNKLAV